MSNYAPWALFLDDERYPPTGSDRHWVICRTVNNAIACVKARGFPNFASFDHDLANEDRAIDFVKWCIEKDLDSGGKLIPAEFQFTVHSENPAGAENIRCMLENYINHRSIQK